MLRHLDATLVPVNSTARVHGYMDLATSSQTGEYKEGNRLRCYYVWICLFNLR